MHLSAEDGLVVAGDAVDDQTVLVRDAGRLDAAERLVIDVATGSTDEVGAIARGLRGLVVPA
ncbi:hypothetical protein [Streptomyces filamentosus]|uniref:hypothetical protein n=1 Tax=Streptomyces filamentosus TaxID=67294 RepID=UPI0037D4E500